MNLKIFEKLSQMKSGECTFKAQFENEIKKTA